MCVKLNISVYLNNLKSFCRKRDAFGGHSKDPGSNPGTVESVSFSTERFQIL